MIVLLIVFLLCSCTCCIVVRPQCDVVGFFRLILIDWCRRNKRQAPAPTEAKKKKNKKHKRDESSEEDEPCCEECASKIKSCFKYVLKFVKQAFEFVQSAFEFVQAVLNKAMTCLKRIDCSGCCKVLYRKGLSVNSMLPEADGNVIIFSKADEALASYSSIPVLMMAVFYFMLARVDFEYGRVDSVT